jgi:MFS family permease
VLTGWALHLGMGVKLVGLVSALPVTAQVLQLAGAFSTVRFGHRRTTLVAVAISRQAFLPLAFLPLLPLGPQGQRTLLLAAAVVYYGFGIVANNGWGSWMGEMVPSALRGRYFGRRTALCATVSSLAVLGAGLAIERGDQHAAAGYVLQALALLACLAGAVTVALMSRQHAAPPQRERTRWAVRAMFRPLSDPRACRVAAYHVAWNGACGLSAPFFGLYLLNDLRAGYTILAAQGAGLALAKVASTSAWGQAVDRLGPKRVLMICTAGLTLSPFGWIACREGRLWPLAVEAVIGGVLLGGHSVASFALPLSVAPARERPFYLAAFAVAGGTAFAVTSSVGATVAEAAAAPIRFRLLLISSAVLRLGAFATAFGLPCRQTLALASRDPSVPPDRERDLPKAA